MHYLDEPSWLAIFNKYGSNPYLVQPGIIQPVNEYFFDLDYHSIKGLLKFHWENDPLEASGGLMNPFTQFFFYYDDPVNAVVPADFFKTLPIQLIVETSQNALLVQANTLIRDEILLEQILASMSALYKELKNN